MTYRPIIRRFPQAYDIGDGGDGTLRVYGDEKVFDVLAEIGIEFCDGCGLPDDCVCPPHNDNDNELGEPLDAYSLRAIDVLKDTPPIERCSRSGRLALVVCLAGLAVVAFAGVIVWALTH